MANSQWSQSQLFVVDRESRTTEAQIELDFTVWHLERGPDGSFYGVIGSPGTPNSAYDQTDGGIVRLDPEEGSLSQFELAEKSVAYLGDMELIGDTVYWVDANTWNLQSFSNVTEL
jgi:hypothetical protein